MFILGSGSDQSVLWPRLQQIKALNLESIAESRPERRHSRLIEKASVSFGLEFGLGGWGKMTWGNPKFVGPRQSAGASTQHSPRRVHFTSDDSNDFCCRVWA